MICIVQILVMISNIKNVVIGDKSDAYYISTIKYLSINIHTKFRINKTHVYSISSPSCVLAHSSWPWIQYSGGCKLSSKLVLKVQNIEGPEKSRKRKMSHKLMARLSTACPGWFRATLVCMTFCVAMVCSWITVTYLPQL